MNFTATPSVRNLMLALAASTALVACEPANNNSNPTNTPAVASAEEIARESARLNEWFETQYEVELGFSPIQQTFLGRPGNQDKIDDFSVEAQMAQLEWKRDSVAEMKANFDYDKLSADAKISYDIWAYQLAAAEAANAFRLNGYTFDQMTAVHAFFPQLLIAFHRVENATDMENYIKRIEGTEVALDQLIALSKESAAAGVRPPRFAFESVLESARQIITGHPSPTAMTVPYGLMHKAR